MQKRASDLLGFRCSFLSFRCCAIYISITAWNCDFPRFLPDFEPFVLVSPDFWICGLYMIYETVTHFALEEVVVESVNIEYAPVDGQRGVRTKFADYCRDHFPGIVVGLCDCAHFISVAKYIRTPSALGGGGHAQPCCQKQP